MQVPRVGVQDGHLSRARPGHARVTVADVGDVVHHVEEGAARLVVEESAEAAPDLEGRAVRQRKRRPEALAPLVSEAARILGRGAEPRRPSEDQIGVGTEGEPGPAGARRGHAGKIPVGVEGVGEDLEVDVRRPVPVLGRRSDRADARPALDCLAGRQARDRVATEVSVEGEEGRGVLRGVLEDHRGPVVEARGVVAHAADGAGKGSRHGRARLPEEVDRQVDRAPLGMLAARTGERVARVEKPRLVVAADAQLLAGGRERSEEPGRHDADVGRLGGRSEHRAPHGEVEDDGAARVPGDHRSHLALVRRDPGFDRRRLRAGRPAAGGAQAVVRQTRMDRPHSGQDLPGGDLADQQVRVPGLGRAPVRRQADAGAQPNRAERPEDGELDLRERADLVVSRGELAGGRDRIGFPENGVGDRHRKLADRPGLDHVAEVQKPGQGPGPGRGVPDENVVVVGVVVDDAARKLGRAGRDGPFEIRDEVVDERASLRVGDLPGVEADDSERALRVPGKVPVDGGRMREAGERRVHAPEKPADFAQQLRGMRTRLGERRPRQVGQQPDPPALRGAGRFVVA